VLFRSDAPIHFTCPSVDDELRAWLHTHSSATLDESAVLRGQGWDVKPTLMLDRLAAGADEVIWIDSDIVVTADFRPLMADAKTVIVAEDDYWNGPLENRIRTEGWKLPVGRALPRLANGGFIRATRAHIPLLQAWRQLLATPEYQRVRLLPFEDRPVHMITDQDVLGALLGSEQFADIPVQFFRRGREIIQHNAPHGYAPLDRVANLMRGTPPLIHCQCEKPWAFPDKPSFIQGPSRYFDFLALEASAYAHFARQYAADLEGLPACLQVRSWPGKLSALWSLGSPHLRGLTYAVLGTASEYLRWLREKGARLARKLGLGSRTPTPS
jgi:hypothetical protein